MTHQIPELREVTVSMIRIEAVETVSDPLRSLTEAIGRHDRERVVIEEVCELSGSKDEDPGTGPDIRANLIRKRYEGEEKAPHLTLVRPDEMEKVTVSQAVFARAYTELQSLLDRSDFGAGLSGIGRLRSDTELGVDTGDRLVYFLAIARDSRLFQAIEAFRGALGLSTEGYHPHVTIGFVNDDVFGPHKASKEAVKVRDETLSQDLAEPWQTLRARLRRGHLYSMTQDEFPWPPPALAE
jgi:hypothetical protein